MDARFDELLERSGWIRELARRLAADVHQADDLVQDAWVAALTRPPARSVSMRGWMARVLRNRAIEQRRRAGHQRAREHEAGGREPEPPADELLERLDLQRAITDAVRELDEPYRSALLLRYFEGLSPKEIARRSDEPVRTVHSRLNRGLRMLRERLQPTDEDERAAWLSGLTALGGLPGGAKSPPPASGRPASAAPEAATGIPAPGTAGAWLMTVKIKVGAALVVAAGLVAAWQIDWRPAAVEAVGAPGAVARGVPRAEDVAGERSEVSVAPVAAADSALAIHGADVGVDAAASLPLVETAALEGRVVGLRGVGIAGVPVRFSPFGQPENGEQVRSEPGGAFAFPDPPSSGQIDAVGTEWATVFQPRVMDGQKGLAVLVVARAIVVSGIVRDENGAPIPEARVELELPDNLRAELDVVIDESHTREWRRSTDEEGRFAFEAVPAVPGASWSVRHPEYVGVHVAQELEDRLHLVFTLADDSDSIATLRGLVVDSDGEPVGGSALVLGDAVSYGRDDGEFVLHVPRDQEDRTLRVSAKGFQPTSLDGQLGVEIEHAFEDPLIVVLPERAQELRGRVLDAQGKPVAGASVWTPDEEPFGHFPSDEHDLESWPIPRSAESIASGDPWGGGARTRDDGRFVLKGLLARPYAVCAFDRPGFRFAVSEPTLPGDELELRLPEASERVTVRGQITSLGGKPIGGAELHFGLATEVHSRTGEHRGVQWGEVFRTDEGGHFEGLDVPSHVTHLRIDGGGLISSVERAIDLRANRTLQLALPLLCRMQVVLTDDLVATHLNVLDASGEVMAVRQKHGWVEYGGHDIDLEGGRSEVLRTSEEATTLVLFHGDDEVLRMPLALDPSELTVVRP